ncbi:TspO/MBR family protein [Marmoricola endophyticus]|uniref:TspO/MBR family protein n=1 Tax=Marmoricola endophyticus TaxID=2040280 RepID=UPI001E3E914D|nr:TspO/MBR family protein [Marmoricola endophyticus]
MNTSALTHRPARPASSLVGLVVAVVLVAVAAGVGALASSSAGSTYDSLEQPPWAPPAGLFGPVWTVLYVLIAVAGWLVWRRYGLCRAVILWGVQLVLNALWTPLFFGAGLYTLALVEIALLDLAVIATIAMFARRTPLAAVLMAPYLLWTLFATALTAAIVTLN